MVRSGPGSAKSLNPELIEVLARPENAVCADCGARAPQWASVKLGVFMCLECSGAHRALGTHISFVQSAKLDKWRPEWISLARMIGNAISNDFYEHSLPGHQKPNGDRDDRAVIANFIRRKYEHREFAPPGQPSPAELAAQGRLNTACADRSLKPQYSPRSSISAVSTSLPMSPPSSSSRTKSMKPVTTRAVTARQLSKRNKSMKPALSARSPGFGDQWPTAFGDQEQEWPESNNHLPIGRCRVDTSGWFVPVAAAAPQSLPNTQIGGTQTFNWPDDANVSAVNASQARGRIDSWSQQANASQARGRIDSWSQQANASQARCRIDSWCQQASASQPRCRIDSWCQQAIAWPDTDNVGSNSYSSGWGAWDQTQVNNCSAPQALSRQHNAFPQFARPHAPSMNTSSWTVSAPANNCTQPASSSYTWQPRNAASPRMGSKTAISLPANAFLGTQRVRTSTIDTLSSRSSVSSPSMQMGTGNFAFGDMSAPSAKSATTVSIGVLPAQPQPSKSQFALQSHRQAPAAGVGFSGGVAFSGATHRAAPNAQSQPANWFGTNTAFTRPF